MTKSHSSSAKKSIHQDNLKLFSTQQNKIDFRFFCDIFTVFVAVVFLYFILSKFYKGHIFYQSVQLAEHNQIFSNNIIKKLTPINRFVQVSKSVSAVLPIGKIIKAGEELKLIRDVTAQGDSFYLCIDQKMHTVLIAKQEIDDKSIAITKSKIEQIFTKYHNVQVQNLTIHNNDKIHFALTIDMCSKSSTKNHRWEYGLFAWLINLAKEKKSSVPIAIAVSNRWSIAEPDLFKYLKSLQDRNLLDIVWINHSTTHPIATDSNGNSFLTHQEVNMSTEILEVEKFLLQHQQLPSVFFRFPGLIYNQKLMKQLAEFSLISIHSDAWINKGQNINNGSIVLLHGNGNEKSGVDKFHQLWNKLIENKLINNQSIVSIYTLFDKK